MTYFEQEQGLIASSYAEHRKQIEATLIDVFYRFAGEDLSGLKNSAEEEKLIRRRLPVFKDAIKRGYPVVVGQLTGEGISCEMPNKSAVKIYRLDQGQLRWQLVPKSDDPFEKLDFLKRTRYENIETESTIDLETDPWIVEQMVREGVKQQAKLAQQFKETHDEVIKTQSKMAHILGYLHSPAVCFDRIREMGTSSEQLFIEQYVITDNPALDTIPQAAQICSQIRTLAEIYKEEHLRNFSKRINSLGIELLTNPASFQNKEALLKPGTTTERIARVRRFIAGLEQLPPEERLTGIHLIALAAANDLQSLIPYFTEMGVSRELAVEFIQGILIKTLKDMPGKQYVQLNNGETHFSPRIHWLYNLNNADTIAVSEKTQKDEVSAREELHAITADAINGQFPTRNFGRVNQSQRETILADIIRLTASNYPERYALIVRTLFNKLNLKFGLDETGSIIIKPNVSKKVSWLPESQVALLTTLKQAVEDGTDNILVAVLNRHILSAVVSGYLKAQDHRSSKDYYFNSITFSGKNRVAALNKAVKTIAMYLLLTRYQAGEPEKASIDDILDKIIRNALDQLDFLHRRRLVEYDSEPIDVINFKELAKQQADIYLKLAMERYLPPQYQTAKKQYILEMFDRSIKRLVKTVTPIPPNP